MSVRFGDRPAGDTVVQDGFVTADAVQNGTTVTVTGHVGAGVNRDNTEQRIVEPALTDTAVGRRDVRALPGPRSSAPPCGGRRRRPHRGRPLVGAEVQRRIGHHRHRVTILRMSSAAANATVRSRGGSRLLGPSTRSRSFTLPSANHRFQVVAVDARGAGAPSARSGNVAPR